jgi:hypothetical protein
MREKPIVGIELGPKLVNTKSFSDTALQPGDLRRVIKSAPKATVYRFDDTDKVDLVVHTALVYETIHASFRNFDCCERVLNESRTKRNPIETTVIEIVEGGKSNTATVELYGDL